MLFSMGLLVHAVYLMLRVQGGDTFPKPLSAEEEADCIARLAAGDPAACDTLIEHNLRLVAHIAKKYYAEPAEQDDLISIGTIGLIKAVSTYKPDKKVRLATYAARCIENEILMYFRAGRKSANDISLSESQDSEDDAGSLRLLDLIAVEDERLHQVEMSDRYEQLYRCLRTCLDEREREVIILRYGLDGGDPLPQREIAKKLCISRSYISRIEKKALSKLSAALR
ncbi:MAG: RNA polymerase sporulation sigma factor SigK [Butyricicoccus sp.]|nr:RNA polymerase sporulation sigma factor SigK [Butyricicoccus sp.]